VGGVSAGGEAHEAGAVICFSHNWGDMNSGHDPFRLVSFDLGYPG
jgi:hypothetical protein